MVKGQSGDIEARGPGFNASSDEMVFLLLGYENKKWIQK